MGADGHIDIYDLDKILTELSEKEVKEICDSTVYIQKFENRNLLTFYWGDNIYHDGYSWSDKFSGCENSDFFVNKDEFDRRMKVILKNRITSWEVWT